MIIFFTPLALAQTAEELKNMDTLNRWGEVWINGNFELVEELVNPVYIRHEPTGTIRVKREIYAERVKSMRRANRKFTTQSLSADKDLIWVRWSMTNEDPETKETIHSRGLQVYRFENGKLAETWWSHTEGQGPWPDL